MRASTALAILSAGLLLAAPAQAADRVGSGFLPDSSSRREASPALDAGEHRTFRKTPAPLAKCDWFPLLEAGVARLATSENQWEDNVLFTNSVGLMRNVSERDALGASVDVHLTNGFGSWAPTVRWRRFVGASASTEVSAGWVVNDHLGVRGPIGQLRYAPVPQVYAQIGATRYRHYEWSLAPDGSLTSRLETDPRLFVGAGCNGVPAAVTTVVEALALAVAFSVVMGD